MYVSVHLSTRYSNRILRIIEFPLQISKQPSNTKFNENSSSETELLDMTKVIATFPNFVKLSDSQIVYIVRIFIHTH